MIEIILIAISLSASSALILMRFSAIGDLRRRATAIARKRTNQVNPPQESGSTTGVEDIFQAILRFLRRSGILDLPSQNRTNLMFRLRRAGRPHSVMTKFIVWKATAPIVLFPGLWVSLGLLSDVQGLSLVLLSLLLSIGGLWIPDVWLANEIQRRQKKIRRAWPDTLDLLQMCMRSGMSLEAALTKVSREMRNSSPEVAEELLITVSELSYLQERRKALENLADRTGVAPVREVVTALIQSQRYGAVLADTLQILAREYRAMRLVEAEKKAASLPPKLTVPMILFFLPALFVVIATPAAINLMSQ